MKLFQHSGKKRKARRHHTSKTPLRLNASKRVRNASSLTRKQRMQAKVRRIQPLPWYFSVALVVVGLAILCIIPSLAPTHHLYEPTGSDDALITLDFAGDVMLGRGIRSIGKAYGYDTLFAHITRFWDSADLVFANLESAVLNEKVSKYQQTDKEIHLWADTIGLQSAIDAGINVFACSNNHAFDYGEKAVLELIDFFQNEDIIYSGIGANRQEAATYELIECNGMTIAFLSITDVYYREAVATDSQGGVLTTGYFDCNYLVYQASKAADATIVYIHWGAENETAANDEQQKLGHQLIDAGADIVIGSHPHVVQEVELYNDGIIFYSLGNFIFDQGNTYASDSVMVEYQLNEDGSGAFCLYPVRISDGVPAVTTNWFYNTRIRRELSQGLKRGSYSLDENGFIIIPFDIALQAKSE